MNVTATKSTSSASPFVLPPLIAKLKWQNSLTLIVLVLSGVYAWWHYQGEMDFYEQLIFLSLFPLAGWLCWLFPPLRYLLSAVALASLWGISLYDADLERGKQVFALKYFLASQSAIVWMTVSLFAGSVCYWADLIFHWTAGRRWGRNLVWIGVGFGLIALLIRWRESYLLAVDIGHIPISNLYEVFILFCLLTALLYLYYEYRCKTEALGAFVLLIINAALGFLLWYTYERGAYTIQPLVPALQSWWMKIHVPANFIGYGSFSLAAMTGFAYLLKTEENNHTSTGGTIALWIAGLVLAVLLALEGIVFRQTGVPPYWLGYFALSSLILSGILLLRRRITPRLPTLLVLDEVMYRAISVGFAFFTIATILGALWAAEAWGSYWSWDPKETWALIVWLNYAAWLHLRMVVGLPGKVLAWWSLVGVLVTTFAFLGVNMFLSGLHSYGTL